MRVLMTVNHKGVHGPINKLACLMRQGLEELGVEVTEVAYARRLATQASEETLLRKIVDRVVDLRCLISTAKQEKPNLLFANTTQDRNSLARDLPLSLVARVLGIPTVLLYHGSRADSLDDSWFLRFVTGRLLSLTDGLLLLSQEEMPPFKKYWPHHRYAVVRYPALIKRTEIVGGPGPVPEAWREAQVPIVLFVGRLTATKGIQEVIEAFPTVLGSVDTRLLVLGEGELTASLQRRVEELGLDGTVYFSGYVEDEGQVWAAYDAASCLVLPTYWREGFPVVIMEAMSAGLPVVCTKVRGPADHLVEGVHVLFVQPRSPAALADKLATLLQDGEMRLKMSEANRALIRHFEPQVVMQDYLDFFWKVTSANENLAA